MRCHRHGRGIHLVRRAAAALPAAPLAAFVDFVGRDGWRALGLAARAGEVEIVEALLDAGADPAAVSATGKTALDIARLNKKDAIVEILEAHATATRG